MHLRKYCTKTGYVHILRLKVSWGARACVCVCIEGKATSNTPVKAESISHTETVLGIRHLQFSATLAFLKEVKSTPPLDSSYKNRTRTNSRDRYIL